jgi:hypothetical protein
MNHKFCTIAIIALILILVYISYRNISNEKEKSDAINYFTDIIDPSVERPLPTLTSRKGTASAILRSSVSETGRNDNRNIETPATIIDQKNYTGTTNIIAPKIHINRNIGGQNRDNKNDLDDFYHL